jgi:hypothetical protein
VPVVEGQRRGGRSPRVRGEDGEPPGRTRRADRAAHAVQAPCRTRGSALVYLFTPFEFWVFD